MEMQIVLLFVFIIVFIYIIFESRRAQDENKIRFDAMIMYMQKEAERTRIHLQQTNAEKSEYSLDLFDKLVETNDAQMDTYLTRLEKVHESHLNRLMAENLGEYNANDIAKKKAENAVPLTEEQILEAKQKRASEAKEFELNSNIEAANSALSEIPEFSGSSVMEMIQSNVAGLKDGNVIRGENVQ